MGLGQNAPQGVEKVHCECRIDIESSDHDDDSEVDGNDDSEDDVMEPGTAFSTSYDLDLIDLRSSCNISRSWVEVIGVYRRQSSANNLVLEVTVFGRSLMYSRNHKGPVTVHQKWRRQVLRRHDR